MKTKTENSLPKIRRGTVHKQFVRCGKPNCKCAHGELHGPYYYHFDRGFLGKLRKLYLRPEEVEEIQAGCAARQQIEKRIRKANQQILKDWRELKAQISQLSDLSEKP